MEYTDWQPTMTIQSPVYLDANVLVGTIVSNHPLYQSCVKLTAAILIAKVSVVISVLALDEAMWAIAKLAYCQLTNNPSKTHWNPKIYEKWCDQIFESYGSWITAVCEMVKDWENAGVNIDFAPGIDSEYRDVITKAPDYMRQFRLTPADAFHLAIAEKRAKTFITADLDFSKLQQNLPSGDLTIIHLPKPLRQL